MCGIFGIYGTRERSGPQGIDEALARLSHRGPDDQGTFHDGSLTLGQTRLSIIDLEGGRQPLYSEDGQTVLVANGEIYNYVELGNELREKGRRFLTSSDSEVILHCYAEYGDGFLDRLHGMFAFALYDKGRKRLILARDRLGIKPLFLARRPGYILFGSEIKALLPFLDREPTIDPLGLAQYLQNQFSSGETTILREVERVLPGEAVVVEEGKISRRWRYWSALDVSPRDLTYAEAQEEFDGIMEAVMLEHMRSDVPFGLFLSGGVDSAVLLALLSRYKGEPVRTYSVGFPGTRLADELPRAKAVSTLFSSIHTEIRPTSRDTFNILPLSVWAADDLMRDYASLPTCLLSAAAGRELKVVFSGEGGDEVFAGYGRYRMSPLERFVKNLLRPGSGGFRTRGSVRGSWPRKIFLEPLLTADRESRQPFITAWSQTPVTWSDLQRMQYTDLVTAMPDNLLVKADRMMMAWSLEGRVPFLDHRVVEFGLSLPDAMKIQSGQGKLFLKRWASRFLPEEHLFAPKKGFHVPVGEWLTDPFLEGLKQVLPDSPPIAAWFRPSGVRDLIDGCRGSSVLGRLVWSLLQFALWHRIFLSGKAKRPDVHQDPLELLKGPWNEI